MILIADSGATKTDWLISDANKSEILKTEGINPFHQDEDYIRRIIETDLLPQIEKNDSIDKAKISEIYFYGAGCLPEPAEKIINILQDFFTGTKVHAYTGRCKGIMREKAGNSMYTWYRLKFMHV